MWEGRKGGIYWAPSEVPSPVTACDMGSVPTAPLCGEPPACPSLPPGCPWPWLQFSAVPPPTGHSPAGLSGGSHVLSWASFSCSGRGQFRVHHVRRASWRERRHWLESVVLERSPAVEERTSLMEGGQSNSREHEDQGQGWEPGPELSPTALPGHLLRARLCWVLETDPSLTWASASRISQARLDGEAGAP